MKSKNNYFLASVICLSSGLFFMYEFFQLGIFNDLNDIFRAEYNLTGYRMSRLSNAFSLGNILFLLPAGVLLDRYSTKKIILITMSICVLGTFGIAISHSVYLTVFSRFLTGIGNAFCLSAGVLLIARWLPENRQALYIGLLVTMAYIGGILNGPSFLYLIETYSWRHAVMIDVAFGVLIILWLAIILKDHPVNGYNINDKSKIELFKKFNNNASCSVDEVIESQSTNNKQLVSLRKERITTGLKEALCNSQNWFGGIYIALINLPIMVFGAIWGITYLKDVHNIKDKLGSEIIVCFFLGAMIGCPLFGWISDKISKRKPIMYFGCVGSILIFSLVFVGIKLSFTTLCVLFFFMGLICGTQVIGYPLISESNKDHCIAKATSIATFLVMFLGAAGSAIFAYILDVFTPDSLNVYTVKAYQNASLIFTIAFFIALIMTFFVRETNCKREE